MLKIFTVHLLLFAYTQSYPDEVPEFKIAIVRLYEEFMTLANKLLEIMGYALKLDVCDKLWLMC